MYPLVAILPVVVIPLQLVGIYILLGIAVGEECELHVEFLHSSRNDELSGIGRHLFRDISLFGRIELGERLVVNNNVGNHQFGFSVLAQLRLHRRHEREEAGSASEEEFLAILASRVGYEEHIAQTIFVGEIDDVLRLLAVLAPDDVDEGIVGGEPEVSILIFLDGEHAVAG